MNTTSTSQQWLGLLFSLLLVFAAAAAGGLASASAGSFFMELDRPLWAPPAWLFGPAWTVLYLLMGVASWLVWRRGGFSDARLALTLYGVQLILNGLWTWLFFVMRSGSLAFVEIIVLWILILATIIAFWRKNKLASLMLVPYLIWVAYASALTFSLWQRNPSVL
ncbi:MAG: tryptophan-rich sensory protein [Ignavibacteria bacterium]|nr:tryptophan-rich sensory protein [Ignavibacteria bacterium]MBK7033772.1 tryptophan-rich sensory protein [Ignavibacteria bacterium]MBK7576292.1 tryptophan-rich sensory protein [Ignavibacteria bacterium]MBK9182265.1 tryptophan-rich sensory protein [Ignavibacteria bacterium]MBL0323123.1 tryptophan-rich sensory protein [Ignavibacteria bacterium]